MIATTVCWLALALAAPGSERVERSEVEGVTCLTIHAQGVPLRTLLSEIGAALEVGVDGPPPGEASALLYVELERRPSKQALEWVLGSAGYDFELREQRLRVFADDPSAEDLAQRALAAYSRALTRFPDDPMAETARMRQSEIEESLGHPGPALQHLDSLIAAQRSGTWLAEAHRRAGRLCEQLLRWKDAGEHYRALAASDPNESVQAFAREQLARCLVRTGDAALALDVLDSLDNGYPTVDPAALERRALMRGMSLATTRQPAEALRELDKVRFEALEPELRGEAMQSLAHALEDSGRRGEAGRAWLWLADQRKGKNRIEAIENAARLALEDSDEIGALLAASLVKSDERTPALQEIEFSARAQLGLSTGPSNAASTGKLPPETRLALAEDWIEKGRGEVALGWLDALSAEGKLAPELEQRMRIAHARAVASTKDVDSALAELRAARAAAISDAARSRYDLCAAELLEAAQDFARAADAYEGRY